MRAAGVRPQRHGHGATRIGVLAGVVQKHGHGPLEARGVAPHGNSLVDGALPHEFPLEGHGFEREGLAFHQTAEVDDACRAFRGLGALRGRSGQIEHIGHKALHALGLHLGALNPLALAGDGVAAALP